jgi:WD40 repeat protein
VRVLQGHKGTVRCVAYAPDGSHLASGGQDGIVRVWDLGEGTSSELPSKDKKHSVEALTFTPDGKRLIVGMGGQQGGLIVWDWLQKKRRQVVETRLNLGVRSLVHLPDRPLVMAASWDRILLSWEVPGGARGKAGVPQPFETEASGSFIGLAASPNGNTLAATTWESEVFLLDTRTGKVKELMEGEDPVQAVAWSPDGKYIATGEQMSNILVWQAEPLYDVAHPEGHEWVVFALAFGPDGRTLLSGGADATVRVWDVPDGKERACYRWTGQCVTCLAVSPDGMTAAAGGVEGTLVLWDLEEG